MVGTVAVRDVQVRHQRLSSAFDLLLIFLIPTLTPPPNNALLANMDFIYVSD